MTSLRFPRAAASVLALAVTLTAALGVAGPSASIHAGNGAMTISHPARPGTPDATAAGLPAASSYAVGSYAVGTPADTARTATVAASRAGLNKAARLADDRLYQVLAQFTRDTGMDARQPGGRPGISVVVQRGQSVLTYRAGTTALADQAAIRAPGSMSLGAGAYALSGAVALALVAGRRLSLGDTAGRWVRGLPRAWRRVTVRQLLQHTSGIPDFTTTAAFRNAMRRSRLASPAPRLLLSYAGRKLRFRPGARYEYSSSDGVLVALMDQAASGESYNRDVRQLLSVALGLTEPAGILSTPDDASVFIRAYVRGGLTSRAVRGAQFAFTPGSSDPPGPGRNSAGLAIFRYQTRCGPVYGYTVSATGLTQFAAATVSGQRSVVVSVNEQITPRVRVAKLRQLRQVFTLAACAALAR